MELSTGLQSLVYTENSAGEITQPWGGGASVCCDGSRNGVVDFNPLFFVCKKVANPLSQRWTH